MKDIKDYEGLYGISSCGRVWSYRSKKFLKPFKPKNGYLCVSLYKNNIRKAFLVHRLVAEAYIPNPNNLPEINHKDEDKSHNWITNLEWCDRKYNCNYGARNDKFRRKVKCVETGEIFCSIKEAAQSVHKHRQGISDCCRGIQKTACGFHWEFIGDDN